DELNEEIPSDGSRSELWQILLLLFLVILICEVLMTRHLVKGGHTLDDNGEPQEESADSSSVESFEQGVKEYKSVKV
ncbi:MAG: hypothetical protein IH899_22270, partial [Planctomycetes bacterium]|nr:hypothetical protein [Planctomycetota bacterium]